MNLTTPPPDADERRCKPPVICYDVGQVPRRDPGVISAWRQTLSSVQTVVVPPRQAACFEVAAGHAFRIHCVEGPQVGDLNLWNQHDFSERFFSGKTRQLHATHVSEGDRLWSNFPSMRPLATITHDTLSWYGWDADGAGVHDVIGTRCDPYTHAVLKGLDYQNCCHSNLLRAFCSHSGMSPGEAEPYIHDVLNVFMCTGFTRDTHQYFMKASPVRVGDYIEFIADIDLLGALSACPGGDCGRSHSDDSTPCYPLHVEILKPSEAELGRFCPSLPSPYAGGHGF